MAKREPTDNAEVNIEVALRRCRALLRPHDPDAVIVLTKAVPNPDGGEDDDLTVCVPMGRTSVGEAVLARAVEIGVWARPSKVSEVIPPDDEDAEEVED